MRRLAELFESREVAKTYLAFVAGLPAADALDIDAPLDDLRSPSSGVQEARTRVRVLERGASAAFVECHPETGRKHQLRRHLALRGTPILGDSLYGDAHSAECSRDLGVTRLCLHASHLRLPHPHDGRVMEISAPLPDDLIAVLGRLRPSPSP
jgi:23S rRNA-/tRNA-specific pseudouridylate synthase